MKKLFTAAMLMFALVPVALADRLQADLMAVEKSLWAAWARKDGEPFKNSLTSDAVEIGAGIQPVVGRDAIVRLITTLDCNVQNISFGHDSLRRLSPGVAAVSYQVTQDAACDGQALPPKLQVTSVYVRQKGRWMQTHYQETPIN